MWPFVHTLVVFDRFMEWYRAARRPIQAILMFFLFCLLTVVLFYLMALFSAYKYDKQNPTKHICPVDCSQCTDGLRDNSTVSLRDIVTGASSTTTTESPSSPSTQSTTYRPRYRKDLWGAWDRDKVQYICAELFKPELYSDRYMWAVDTYYNRSNDESKYVFIQWVVSLYRHADIPCIDKCFLPFSSGRAYLETQRHLFEGLVN